MSEVVNLQRVRKAKARAESARRADENRAKHGVGKAERDLARAQADKLDRAIAVHELENNG